MQTKGRQSGQYGFLTNRSAKWHGLGPFSFFIGSPVVDASECGCVIFFGHRLTGPLGLLVSSDCCHYYCLLLDFWLARTQVGINRHSQASDPVVPPINIESKLFCRLFYFSISSRVKVPLFCLYLMIDLHTQCTRECSGLPPCHMSLISFSSPLDEKKSESSSSSSDLVIWQVISIGCVRVCTAYSPRRLNTRFQFCTTTFNYTQKAHSCSSTTGLISQYCQPTGPNLFKRRMYIDP